MTCLCLWLSDSRVQNGLTLAYMVFYGLMSGKEVCYMNHMGPSKLRPGLCGARS